jgi:chromosome segregation ATPase
MSEKSNETRVIEASDYAAWLERRVRKETQEERAALRTDLAAATSRAELAERERETLLRERNALATRGNVAVRERNAQGARAERAEAALAAARAERDEAKRLLEGAHKANEILGAKAIAAGEERDRLLGLLGDVNEAVAAFTRSDDSDVVHTALRIWNHPALAAARAALEKANG